MDSQFPIALVPHRWLTTPELRASAHRALVGFIAKSLEQLVPGRLQPDGAWSAIFFAWTGDLKARREAHLFRASYAHTYVCDRCCAQQAHKTACAALLYQNFHDSAGHRLTCLSHGTYLRAHADRLSPWVQVPGWTLERTLFDAMHVVFLGIARDHVAAHLVLWTECGFVRDGVVPGRCGLSPSNLMRRTITRPPANHPRPSDPCRLAAGLTSSHVLRGQGAQAARCRLRNPW
jgi:hypothetical protein